MKDEEEKIEFKFEFYPTAPEEWCWFKVGRDKVLDRYSGSPPDRYTGFSEGVWYTEADWGCV